MYVCHKHSRIHPFLWNNMDANSKLFAQCAYISLYCRIFSLSNLISSNRRLQSADAISRSQLAGVAVFTETKQTNSCSHLPSGHPKCYELEDLRNMRGHISQQLLRSFAHPRAGTPTLLSNTNLRYISTRAIREIHTISNFSDYFCR
jgi:hypothetical protein